MIAVAVLLAGALGAVSRFVVDGAVKHRRALSFPWATVGINVSGSFLLGLIAGLVTYHAVPVEWQAIVGTGFCGGYTTFSTASFESVRLAQQRRPVVFAANAFGSLVASVIACALGLLVAWVI
ncbi:fluoride efflux transporter CrcB [Gordonia sinesedis]